MGQLGFANGHVVEGEVPQAAPFCMNKWYVSMFKEHGGNKHWARDARHDVRYVRMRTGSSSTERKGALLMLQSAQLHASPVQHSLTQPNAS